MNNNINYVPVLKLKSGEKESINQLHSDHKNRIMLLIELVDSTNLIDLANELSSTFTGSILVDNIVSEDSNYEFYKELVSTCVNKDLIPVFYINDLLTSLH